MTADFEYNEAPRPRRRLAVVVRSLMVGFLVFAGGQPVLALLFFNLEAHPFTPWSLAPGALYLWFYWRYLKGQGWPGRTKESRRTSLRAQPLTPTLWRWSLLAGGLAIASAAPLAFMFPIGVDLPPALQPPALLRAPALTSIPLLLMLAAIAGIVEEAAFRGYMQHPIEKHIGPAAAILVVTVVFALVHLPGQKVTAVRMLLIVIASIIYGILAYVAGSILPGIVLHAAGNAFSLCLLWWLSVHGGSGRPRPNASAALVALYLAEIVALGLASVWAFRRLVRAAHGVDRANRAQGQD